jgi:hypothetical protein
MKLSNFRDCVVANSCLKSYALIDCTTGYLWWKKTVTRVIQCDIWDSWKFADTGKKVKPYKVIRELESDWVAKETLRKLKKSTAKLEAAITDYYDYIYRIERNEKTI